MNRRFSRAKALLSHGGSSRGISCLLFTRMVLVPNLRIVEFFFTRSIAESHGVLSRIIELSNFFSHGESRKVKGFCHELSNFFSHGESRRFSLSQDMFLVTNLRIIEFLSSRGMSRMVTDVYLEFSFLYRDLSFGPTGQREVIIELVYFHTEHRGESRFYCPETCPLDPLTNGK